MSDNLELWSKQASQEAALIRAIASANTDEKITKRMVREYHRSYLLTLKKLRDLEERGNLLGDSLIKSKEYKSIISLMEHSSVGVLAQLCNAYFTNPKSPLKQFVERSLEEMWIRDSINCSPKQQVTSIELKLLHSFKKLNIQISESKKNQLKKQIKYLVDKGRNTSNEEDLIMSAAFRRVLRRQKSILPKGK